ncbi:hypothetical protein B0H11DRAFT_1988195 [Mycena galericulata]|nr:hypothetical protein B0H11DRAFT_1988195 [Mycena galericulata]
MRPSVLCPIVGITVVAGRTGRTRATRRAIATGRARAMGRAIAPGRAIATGRPRARGDTVNSRTRRTRTRTRATTKGGRMRAASFMALNNVPRDRRRVALGAAATTATRGPDESGSLEGLRYLRGDDDGVLYLRSPSPSNGTARPRVIIPRPGGV